MNVHYAEHLSKIEKIQLGSYYTPENIVKIVHNIIKPYINEKTIIFDNAGGCGSFINELKFCNYRIAEYDKNAYNYLKNKFNNENIFNNNSLLNVTREKYNIKENDFLIMIGNPPYNDITSEFKKGKKGQIICDEDLKDRDIGISFLKSYNKLKADIVCILHPLSYLIKETNFKRLKDFKNNYKLIKGIIFSSSFFKETGNQKFPIIIALYKRDNKGMDFEYIKNFEFNILNKEKKFFLSKFKTTDGFINKYPPRKNEQQVSPIGLYYWTFRDFNSLKKNTSFLNYKHSNGIIVNLDNFYKYAYLYCLKELFKPEDEWLYGNLSPLIDFNEFEKNKLNYIIYALNNNKILKNMGNNFKKMIFDYYKINNNILNEVDIEKNIIKSFKNLEKI